MRKFRNPTNGYEVTCGRNEICGGILFGPIYMFYKGIVRLAIILLVIDAALYFHYGPPGTLLVVPCNIITAFFIPAELARKYLMQGMVEVTNGAPQQPQVFAETAGTKPCPYCAETIKSAAIRCKHCGADLTITPTHTPAP